MQTLLNQVGDFAISKRLGDGCEAYADNPTWASLRVERDANSVFEIGKDFTSIMGFPVVIDRSVPANELHFRHPDGRVDKLVFAALAERPV